MSDKTQNQQDVNKELTALLNKKLLIRHFNIFAINLLNEELAAIEWDQKKFVLPPYWFFIKGGTSLGLLFDYYNTPDLIPEASDWDTQIVINPDYDFDLWYAALLKISDAVNRALVLGNMAITMMPGASHLIKEQVPQHALSQKLHDEWGGNVKYRQSPDRKTLFTYEYFHPFQPGDTGRQRFAHTRIEKWHDSAALDSIQNTLFPLETVEFNQQEYRDLNLWRTAHKSFGKFLAAAEYSKECITEYEKNWARIHWKLEYVNEKNKSEAMQDLKTYFAKTLDQNASVSDVQQEIDDIVDDSPPELLASGQRTLSIDEFYLYRLVVRYKYEKPEKSEKPTSKQTKDYIDAWTASGNLRGELIDVTVPRRDSFEARHHGELLKNGQWKILTIPTLVSGQYSINLPVLDADYQITEQILIVREVLAGKSSSPSKLEKRLIRGYALGRGKDAQNSGRKAARDKLIQLLDTQFSTTFRSLSNHKINELIAETKKIVSNWSEQKADTKSIAELRLLFEHQCMKSHDNLLNIKLSSTALANLTTFTPQPDHVDDYPDVWGKSNDKDQQNNAGRLDFFYLVTLYANLADRIQAQLKGFALPLAIRSPRQCLDPREIIKFTTSSFANDGYVFPQVIGRAATYYHLKDLSEIFDKVDDVLPVATIDIRIINFGEIGTIKKIRQKSVEILEHIGSKLLEAKEITEYRVDIGVNPVVDVLWVAAAKTGQVQAYLRLHLRVPLYKYHREYQTEYAYGIPVIRLQDHILNLQSEIGAAEFSQSQIAKQELSKLQRALSVREFAARNTETQIPPLKRQLSSSDLLNL